MASHTHIYIPAGFETGWIYELVYEAKDPLVLGLGHVAVRDFISFLKYEGEDAAGQTNPLRERSIGIDKAYGWGRSQSGRCIRDFVHAGFNEDARGRRVFDGVLPHVAGAGLMWINTASAMSHSAGQQYEDHITPRSLSLPIRLLEHTISPARRDPERRRPTLRPGTHKGNVNTGAVRAGPRIPKAPIGGRDGAGLPGPAAAFCHLLREALTRGVCQQLSNVVRTSMLFRAMLRQWMPRAILAPARQPHPTPRRRHTRCHGGVAAPVPPHPRRGDPLRPERAAAPRVRPGVRKRLPEGAADRHARGRLHGAGSGGRCGRQRFRRRAGADGGGAARHLHGWDLRARSTGAAMHEFTGSTIPLPDSPEERRDRDPPARSRALSR